MLVTAIKEKAVETAETVGAGEEGKKSEGSEYLRNLAQVLYIRYSITF